MKKLTTIFLFIFSINFLCAQFNAIKPISFNTYAVFKIKPYDLDNDGDLDLLYSKGTSTSGQVAWLKNNGNGTITYSPTQELADNFDVNSPDARAFDIDNDGDLDIVYSHQDLFNSSIHGYAIQENLGGGNFLFQNEVASFTDSDRLELVDFDNDGLVDIFISGSGPRSGWLKNLGGTFAPIDSLFAGSGGDVLDDIDNDGDIDIIVDYSGISWIENLGSGNFATLTNIYSPPSGSMYTNLIDIDSDGDKDIISCYWSSNEIRWNENLGGGNFAAAQVLSTQAFSPTFLAGGDVDNDGDEDIIMLLGGGNSISWFENTGNGNFQPPVPINSHPDGYSTLEIVDIDNDSDIDIIATPCYCVSTQHPIVWIENFIYHTKQISGDIFIDENLDGLKNVGEAGIGYHPVLSTPQSDFSYTNSIGAYSISFSDTVGNYITYPNSIPNWAIVTDSLVYNIYIDSTFTSLFNLDFGFYPDTLINELSVELTGSFPRCNDTINYWVDIKNIGTIVSGGLIHLQLDDSIKFVNSQTPPDSINGQNIYWHYDSLYYFTNHQLNLSVSLPDFNSIGDTLISYLNVGAFDTLGNYSIVYTKADTFNQVLVCAYDPNDKIATPTGRDSLGFISSLTTNIEYTIRFQNTGNDTAQTVIIKDQLDTNLLWQTLNPLASSDMMQIDVDQKGEVIFTFNNILLPDSGADFLGSQGFVKYKIDLKPNLPSGTQVFNTANIYFDHNPAIVTNTKIHTIDSTSTVSINDITNDKLDLVIYPNPFNDYTTIEFKEDLKGEYDIYIYDIVGKEIHSQLKLKENKYVVSQSNIGKGIYLLNIINNKTGIKYTRKIISQ